MSTSNVVASSPLIEPIPGSLQSREIVKYHVDISIRLPLVNPRCIGSPAPSRTHIWRTCVVPSIGVFEYVLFYGGCWLGAYISKAYLRTRGKLYREAENEGAPDV